MSDFNTLASQSNSMPVDEIQWQNCLCHKTGETGLTPFTDQSWKTFKRAAEVRRDGIYDKMKICWSEGPKGFYHRKCYQLYTIKRNVQACKRKSEKLEKPIIKPRPAKLPRTFDKSKCIICLTDKSMKKDRRRTESLCRCLTENAVENMRAAARKTSESLLLKRLDSGVDILYHKSCHRKLTKLSSATPNKNSDNAFDSSFEILAKEVEINIIKGLKVVTSFRINVSFSSNFERWGY